MVSVCAAVARGVTGATRRGRGFRAAVSAVPPVVVCVVMRGAPVALRGAVFVAHTAEDQAAEGQSVGDSAASGVRISSISGHINILVQ